jgi:hypothetical protein
MMVTFWYIEVNFQAIQNPYLFRDACRQHTLPGAQVMTQRKSTPRPTKADLAIRKPKDLLAEVREMILQARESVARAVDSGLTTLYWYIGHRIRQDILKEKRAEYGEEIVSALGRQLTWTYFKSVIYIDDPLKRDFYAEMCRIEGWSTRTLEAHCQRHQSPNYRPHRLLQVADS